MNPLDNNDLWTDGDGQEYSIMTYNINCSLLAMIPQEYFEKYPELSSRDIVERFPDICSLDWLSRLDRIESLICKYDADIVCLQELRKLPECADPVIWLYQTFGNKYEIFYSKRNSSDLAFGQAIMWKKDKFSPLDYKKKWISPTPDIPSNGFQSNGKGFGQIALGVLLHPCANEKFLRGAKSFWVWNAHLLLEEDLKTKSCMMLCDLVKGLTHESVFVGDFNLFPDKEGPKQFDILMEVFNNLTQWALTSQGQVPIRGTFIGTKNDKFRRKIEKIRELEPEIGIEKAIANILDSKLDQVLGTSGIKLVGTPLVITETMLPKEPKEFDVMVDGQLVIDYPSDHMPVLTKFVLQ